MKQRTTALACGVFPMACLLPWAVPAQTQTGAPSSRAGYVDDSSIGGPTSVGNQLAEDDRVKGGVLPAGPLDPVLQKHVDFKSFLHDRHGLTYGLDYNAWFQAATDSPGDDTAAGGVARFFGQWKLLRHHEASTGSVVYKIENRHRLGTDLSPQALGPAVGYAGLTASTYSDADWILSNLYWDQRFWDNRFGYVAGIVDVTDYVDVFALASPWTDFGNLAFETSPTIPAPSQGMGVAARLNLTDSVYLLAGLADANGDPSRPDDSVEAFFEGSDYFSHGELGWFPSWDERFIRNVHVTGWHADEREASGVQEGWGAAVSASYLLGERWLPFARAGYSDGGGGAFSEGVISLGTGYFLRDKADILGFGVSWDQPSEETFGANLRDQYTVETYYRLQVQEHLALTPDLQVLFNPALNPDEDVIAVVGLRARLAF